MTLRLYDTAAHAVRPFQPLAPGKASIYVCGATVQSEPHLGHIRSGVNFDLLRRWLERSGYDVTFVRNVTDIDDKILRKAESEGVPYWVIAARNERAFAEAYRVLGCLPPTVEPRATGHIPEMITLMRRIINEDHAYPAGGDVYFDVSSYPEYGALSRQQVEHMQPAEDAPEDSQKLDPRDFALWKGARPGEPAWGTPWGPGRPGWHLECSAMSLKYLGPEFDIHGGGLDLVFPHHENEIAQSRAAGNPFARYWMHNAWVTLAGEKMSKSLGNVALVAEVIKRHRPVEVRYFLAAPHYRSTVEFSEDSLAEAAAAYHRIEGFVLRAVELVGEVEPGELPAAFVDAMDDDLGVPQALAVLHNRVREGNTALTAMEKDAVASALAEVRAMLDVVGLDPLDEHWTGAGDAPALRGVVDGLVSVALRQREAARARKDFEAADAIREELRRLGVVVEDTPGGSRWTLES